MSSWHGTKRGHGTKESWQLRHVRLEEEHLQQCRVPVLPGRCWRWQSHVVHWPGHFLRGMIWVWVKTCQDLWTYHMIKGITWNNHPKTSYLRDLGIFRVPRVPSRVPGFDPYGMNTEWCCYLQRWFHEKDDPGGLLVHSSAQNFAATESCRCVPPIPTMSYFHELPKIVKQYAVRPTLLS